MSELTTTEDELKILAANLLFSGMSIEEINNIPSKYLNMMDKFTDGFIKLALENTNTALINELKRIVDDKPLTTMYVPLNLYVERIEDRIKELEKKSK